MSRYEQESDLGGGGEVDEDSADEARENAEERRPKGDVEADDAGGAADGPQPWAKTSSGDADSA
jgi:hypothetical protein